VTDAVNRAGLEHPPMRSAPRIAGRALVVVVIASVFVLDQAVKLGMTAWLGPDSAAHRWELAGRFLAFEYVENRGAAFGLLAGQTLLLALAAVVATLILLTGLARATATSRLVSIGLALVVGGALGNLIDRVRLGYVVDFLAVGIWPKFNVADCAITIGLLLLGWYAVNERNPESQPRSDDRGAT
jgi:signal peptidase II